MSEKGGWTDEERHEKFVRAITETESEVGLNGLQAGGDIERIVWLRRHFEGEDEEDKPPPALRDATRRSWDWIDMDQSKLDDEKHKLQQALAHAEEVKSALMHLRGETAFALDSDLPLLDAELH